MSLKRTADQALEPMSKLQAKEEWKEYERNFFKENLSTLLSHCCNAPLKNKYGGGNPHASGIQAAQIQCLGCFSKHTIMKWLELSNSENSAALLQQYCTAVKAINVRQSAKAAGQARLTDFFPKKILTAEDICMDGEIPPEQTQTGSWADEPVDTNTACHDSKISELQTENLKLKAINAQMKKEYDQMRIEIFKRIPE